MRVEADMLVNRGGGSLLSGKEQREDAGDLIKGSWETSADMLQQWVVQYRSLTQKQVADRVCVWVT